MRVELVAETSAFRLDGLSTTVPGFSSTDGEMALPVEAPKLIPSLPTFAPLINGGWPFPPLPEVNPEDNRGWRAEPLQVPWCPRLVAKTHAVYLVAPPDVGRAALGTVHDVSEVKNVGHIAAVERSGTPPMFGWTTAQ